jgi:acyl-CoA reductase-like NAD-dependent aldehyde dehydrogenase
MATAEVAATMDVQNPATGEVIASVPLTSPEDVPGIVAAARAAQPAWEALGFEGRARILKRAQKWLFEHAEEVADTIVSETGKARDDALLVEVAYGANALGFWAKKAPKWLADERVHSTNPIVLGRRLVVRYRPVGVVGVIGPWNYPLVNSVGDAIPALAAGNAVVVKPSHVTPLTSMLFERILRDAGLPKGIFQVAVARGDAASVLIDEVDMVMFTGSTATGRKVMERAAQTLTPVSLELGGKDPMIVLADANLERAANAAVYYSMQNGGQTCISIERVYVEAPVYDRFVSMVAEKTSKLRQGPPGELGAIDVGAVTSPPQIEIVERHVQQARDAGARVVAGGHRGPGPGLFFEPTVIADADHSMAAMTEETFGPTLPIMKVADEEEAIRQANDSPYGLAAAVFTGDLARGEAVARRIEAGAVCVNDAAVNYLALELPMGGWKESGLGVRHGPAGLRKYTRQQALLVNRVPLRRDAHFFPYNGRVTKLMTRGMRLLWDR